MAGKYKYKWTTAALERLWAPAAPAGSGEEEAAELGELVESFYEGIDGEEEEEVDRVACSGRAEEFAEMLDLVLAGSGGRSAAAEAVRVEVEDAVRAVGSGSGSDGLKWRVVCWLRERGVDAGLCKSQWERENCSPSGYHHHHHEYIDVIAGNGKRYIVETNLAGEFEIARPTPEYAALLGSLPGVFVARPGALRGVVKVMCAAAKESIRSAGMHVPPWRTKDYMLEKWFGSYERSTKLATVAAVATGGGAAACNGAAGNWKKKKKKQFCRMDITAQGGRNFAPTFRGM